MKKKNIVLTLLLLAIVLFSGCLAQIAGNETVSNSTIEEELDRLFRPMDMENSVYVIHMPRLGWDWINVITGKK
ncbi:MAG TPA: hypothetical protein VER35_00260 [Candidatus Limnocylindrales bacterium]|nr:hypothetical protein [Candidatus Limnocylindrales bacterium]